MKKIEKNKILMYAIIGVSIFLILSFIFRPNIKFTNTLKLIEYGSTYSYEQMIESIHPKDAEIMYPEFQATEVGNYNLAFKFKKGNKTYSKNYKFTIKDTTTPLLTLYFIDESVKVRLNDTNIDLLANLHIIENLSVEACANRVRLNEEEFDTLIKDVREVNTIINTREITKQEDIKTYDVSKNGIFYTTDLDVTKVGSYTMRVFVIDENYNGVETQWTFDVVESDQLLNSGGRVTCTYNGDDLSGTEAYSVLSIENYKYDPFRLVTEYEIVTKMTFSDDYDTDENIELMLNDLNTNYGVYKSIEGVTVSIYNQGNVVITSIKIDLLKYNKEEDSLGILTNKSNNEIDMQSVLNSADANKYVCRVL